MIEWRILQNKYVVTSEALDGIGKMGDHAARKRRRAESETAVCESHLVTEGESIISLLAPASNPLCSRLLRAEW